MDDYTALVGWLLFVVVAIVVGLLVVLSVRRWARRDVRVETFTFQDLREMRDRGDISQQEFQSMRQALLGRMADQPADEPRDARGDDSVQA